jgi:hypothetical protein
MTLKQDRKNLKEQKTQLANRCVLLYALGLDYSQFADELTHLCTDAEWEEFNARFAQVDEWMVDAGCGTLAQAEKVNAQRQGRSPILNVFLLEPEKKKAIAQIAKDLKAAGIPFGNFVFVREDAEPEMLASQTGPSRSIPSMPRRNKNPLVEINIL